MEEETLKIGLISLFRIVNTMIYNTVFEEKGNAKMKNTWVVGILSSPVMFWNFEAQIRQVSKDNFEFFNEEVVVSLIELLVQ